MELPINEDTFGSPEVRLELVKLDLDKLRIAINNRWFNIINPSELECKRNKNDGYYRVIYIQINTSTGEYYVGKANRPKWSEIQRYQGSGLLFSSKFKKRRLFNCR